MKTIILLVLSLFVTSAYAISTASSQAPSATGLGAFPLIYPGNEQKVAYVGSSVRSVAFGAKTSVVRMICTTDCHVKFGTTAAPTTPTAVGDGTCSYLKAGIEYYFAVIPLAKVAVIQDASGGNLFISEGL